MELIKKKDEMLRNKKSQLIFILILFLAVIVFGQDARYSTDEKMKEEILSIYKNNGEVGLRNFLKGRIAFLDDNLIPILSSAGVNEKKEDLLNIALIIAEEKKNEQLTAYVHFMMGWYFSLNENFEKMIFYWEKTLPILEKINKPEAPRLLKIMKNFISAFKNNLSDFEKILSDVLPLIEEEGNFAALGNLYDIVGNILGFKGDIMSAFKMFDKALSIYEKTGNLDGQGKIYFSKGLFYAFTTNFEKSLILFEKALSFFEKTGNLAKIAQLDIFKGDIYVIMGENLKAIDMYDQAIIICEKRKDISEIMRINLAKGNVYRKSNEEGQYAKILNHALALYQKEKNYTGLYKVYYEKGLISFFKGGYIKSLEMMKMALFFSVKSGYYFDRWLVYEAMGNIYSSKGKYHKALKMFEKALIFHEKSNFTQLISPLLISKAKILEVLNRKDEARDLFEEAIEKFENFRRLGTFPWIKENLMENFYFQYIDTIAFMLKNKYYEKGFKYTEAMKARVFLDQIAEGLEKVDKGISSELNEKRDKLISRLSFFGKKITEYIGNDEKKLEELKEQYEKTENEFNDLVTEIRLKNSEYASIRYPEPLDIITLQKDILRDGELMLQYFVTKERTYVFLISRENFQVIPLDITEEEINANINRYFLHFNKASKNQLLTKDIIKGMKKYGNIFYQSIFKPFEKSLKGANDIIIVPDGQLALIPFESFVIDDSNPNKPIYLLEKYRLKYIQSATTLSMIRKYYHRESNTKSFIGFGDPIYDYENYKQRKPECGTPEPIKGSEIQEILRSKYEREGGLFNRLSESGKEVKIISELFNKNNQKAVVHLREDATEENSKIINMKSFDYIHFSCHGVLGDNYQSLVLSQIPQAKEDGYLTLNEIMNCDYNAKLVVLSACQTGTGKIERAEGVTGLTRAMMYAGTPAVVASLWNVSENGTKELMVRFYRNMLEQKMSIEEALRKAKLELIQSEKFYSPFFWSAFVLYGDGVE